MNLTQHAKSSGKVVATLGELVRVKLPLAAIGEGARIDTARGSSVLATVIGIDANYVTVMPHGKID